MPTSPTPPGALAIVALGSLLATVLLGAAGSTAQEAPAATSEVRAFSKGLGGSRGGAACRYVAERNALRVRLRGRLAFAELRRDRRQIEVADIYGRGDRRCRGNKPSVDNTDVIHVNVGDRLSLSYLVLDLAQGRFGPGATPEQRAGSEIELDVEVARRQSYLLLEGSRRKDSFTFGSTPQGLGVNLNAAEAQRDIDVRLRGEPEIYLDGGARADRIVATGAHPFTGPYPHELYAQGGDGRDVIVGSADGDYLIGGSSRDTVLGRDGNDNISLRDGHGHDRASCGLGRDRLRLDPNDDGSPDCERVGHHRR